MHPVRLLIILLFFAFSAGAQGNFNYSIELVPVNIPGLPGLHSYAFAQQDGKWLIIGGRKDGIHARQPFNAFPASMNNTDIFVVDPVQKQVWSATVNSLPPQLSEQLQSTNMNFFQQQDTLYIMGGYAFAASENDHITFPRLITIQVRSLISSIIQGASIQSHFKYINDERFAVTGGQLGRIGDVFYLAGGHRFDGRYNPMGNPTFIQTYTNQVRRFRITNGGAQPLVTELPSFNDALHLRRRDYNLLPQVFSDGSHGLMISSGVFQPNVDLPFLYPVEIRESGITARTEFNQYLSNYHSAKASLFDSLRNEMHTLFFGGISQYYYSNESLIQDNQVPFVRTISLLTRQGNGNLKEFRLPVEMPSFYGAGAEFIPNPALPHEFSEVIRLDKITSTDFVIGHIYGGINSSSMHPFSNNNTASTSAANILYSVKLTKNTVSGIEEMDGRNPYSILVYPNPFENRVEVVYQLPQPVRVQYFISNHLGQLIRQGRVQQPVTGKNTLSITLDEIVQPQGLVLTMVFENKFFVSEKIIRK